MAVDVTVWPGHLDNDSLGIIDQTQSGSYTNWWSPLFEWAWHLPYKWGFGPGWMLTAQVAGMCAGIYLLLRIVIPRGWAAVLTALIALSPPVFSQTILLGRDMWFMSTALLTFGCAARAIAAIGGRRVAWLVAAVIAAWLAQAARQNAISVLFFAFAFVVWALLAELGDAGPWRRVRAGRWRAVAAIGAAAVMSVALYAEQYLQSSVVGVHRLDPAQALYIYDLEVLSHRLNRNLFPPSVLKTRGTAPIDAYYSPDDMIPMLLEGIGAPDWISAPHELAQLKHEWISTVENHPFDYLAERFSLLARNLSLTRAPYVVYQPNNFGDNSLGLHVEHPSLDRIAVGYIDAFTEGGYQNGSFLLDAWIYLLLATAGMVVIMRSRAPNTTRALFAVLGLSAWGLQAGLLFTMPGNQYRFQGWTLAVGLLLACSGAKVAYQSGTTRVRYRR